MVYWAARVFPLAEARTEQENVCALARDERTGAKSVAPTRIRFLAGYRYPRENHCLER